MRFWLSKNSGIPLKDQLTRQIILAIISGDLASGSKLPSVRELGRRNNVHPNTVTAAYRWLEENGWTESRSGSGVYVKAVTQDSIEKASHEIEHELDKAVFSFIRDAKQRGFSTEQIKSRLARYFDGKKPQKIVIFERDRALAAILEHELSGRFSLPIFITTDHTFNKDALVVSISDFPYNLEMPASFVKLKLNSVQDSMQGKTKPEKTDLIGIVSHWEQFRRWSQTMLVAVGIDEDNLVVRDTNETNWRDGLHSCKLVIADTLTANDCQGLKNVSTFSLISENSFEEMQEHLG